MRIGVLSFRSKSASFSYEEERIRNAVERGGHEALMYCSAECQVVFDRDKLYIYNGGEKFPKLDLLIPRASFLSDADLKVSIIREFEQMGVKVLNSWNAVVQSKNKVRTQQVLHAKGIPTLKTAVIEGMESLEAAIDMVGGAPVILKEPYGTYGNGVIIAESKRAAKSVLDSIWAKNKQKILMVQEYISESNGEDTRVFVVGEKVVASMKRSAQAWEFRSNVELGAMTEAVDVSEEYKEIAIASTKALGLDYAGVDIIHTQRGPAVLEVNSNPGFKALEAATSVDIAAEIVSYGISKLS